MLVGQDLDLDVTRVLQELLHVHHGIVKGGLSLGPGHGHRIEQCGFGVHHAHAATATATGGFDDDWVTDEARSLDDLSWIVRQCAFDAGHTGHAGFFHGALGGDFVAHQANRLGTRADEDEAGLLYAFGEVRILGQESIAGVNGLRIGHLGGADDGGDIEVAQAGAGGPDTDGFVR